MRILASLILLALLPATAHATATCVKSASATSQQTTVSVSATYGSGDGVVIGIRQSFNLDEPTVDDGTNTYTKIGGVDISNVGGDAGWLFYAKNVTGGTFTVTATWGGAGQGFRAITVCDVDNMDTSSPLDAYPDGANPAGNNSGGSNVSTLTTGSFTTSVADEIIFAFFPTDNTTNDYTAGSGYTAGATASDFDSFMQYKVVSSTQSGVTTSASQNAGTSHWGALVASFKTTAAPAPQGGFLF